jgi:hypothetical protein
VIAPLPNLRRLGTIVLVLGGSISAVGCGANGQVALRSACSRVTKPTLFQPTDFPGFVRDMQGTYKDAPWKGRLTSHPPAFVTGFVQGRAIGYVTRLAVHHHRLPMVPLVGSIVPRHPGLLEVYEFVETFRTATAARSWFQFKFVPTNSYWRAVGTPNGVSEGFARAGRISPAVGSEHVINYVALRGNRVVRLSFQGGAALQPSLISGDVQKAMSSTGMVCQ